MTWADGRVVHVGQWLEGRKGPGGTGGTGGTGALQRLQRKRDKTWERQRQRRRDWMIATTPRGEITDGPIQKAVFDIKDIYRHVTSFL